MPTPQRSEDRLIEKIRGLSPEWLAQLEDLVDSLRELDAAASFASLKLSEGSFNAVWDNPEDAAYDRL